MIISSFRLDFFWKVKELQIGEYIVQKQRDILRFWFVYYVTEAMIVFQYNSSYTLIRWLHIFHRVSEKFENRQRRANKNQEIEQ